jgi:hypothetical protein
MNTIYSIPIRKRCENLNYRHRNDVTFNCFLTRDILLERIALSSFLTHYLHEPGPTTFFEKRARPSSCGLPFAV